MRNPSDPIWHSAWQEGELLMGDGVVNDKGPMAAFLLAAKAIKRSGVKLQGDLVLTMVCGEIGQEPVDEFAAPQYLSKEVGARYMVSRGVIADYAIVAEGTDFQWAWAGAGKAFFKITVYGRGMYTPLLPPRTAEAASSPNAIVRMASFVHSIEAWAARYETQHTQDTPGGRIVPKVNIGAIRGGHPARILSSPEVCSVYLDVRLALSSDVLGIKADLVRLLREAHLEGEVELFTYRLPQVAEGVEPICDAIARAHAQLGMEKPGMARTEHSSMWRDHIPMIEAGIAALTYGPGAATGGPRLAMRIDDLVRAAHAYALIAMDVCNRPRARRRNAGALSAP
jgi:acetylornithine deacetylase/succinyl-diaminopimelate desuccinylase-like protein